MTSNLTLAKLFLVLAFVLLAIPPRRAYEICVCDSVLNANDPEAEPVHPSYVDGVKNIVQCADICKHIKGCNSFSLAVGGTRCELAHLDVGEFFLDGPHQFTTGLYGSCAHYKDKGLPEERCYTKHVLVPSGRFSKKSRAGGAKKARADS